MQTRCLRQRRGHRRGGWLAPIVALALMVVLGAVALVLDRLWLDMASTETQSVADAAALAAARQLASDDDLRTPAPAPEQRITAAQLAAETVASMNHVAGQPFDLSTAAGDVKFGVRVQVEETGEIKFVETIHDPRAVQVLAQRTHERGNPVALLIQGLTNVHAGEVRALAEATIDNHVVGFQTIGAARIPMIPLAILAFDPSGRRKDTWQVQIGQRLAMDQYRFDPASGKVLPGADGIPEMILAPNPSGKEADTTNMAFFDVHGEVGRFPLAEQLQHGLSPLDLERRDGRLIFVKGSESFPAQSMISKSSADALRAIIGECRGVLLYQNLTSSAGSTRFRIQSAGLVAGRIMAVESLGGLQYRLVFQPGVLATRSAVRPADIGRSDTSTVPNPYLYQLKLTQ